MNSVVGTRFSRRTSKSPHLSILSSSATSVSVDSAPATPEDLRTVEVFADLSAPDLQWLIDQSEVRDFAVSAMPPSSASRTVLAD